MHTLNGRRELIEAAEVFLLPNRVDQNSLLQGSIVKIKEDLMKDRSLEKR